MINGTPFVFDRQAEVGDAGNYIGCEAASEALEASVSLTTAWDVSGEAVCTNCGLLVGMCVRLYGKRSYWSSTAASSRMMTVGMSRARARNSHAVSAGRSQRSP